MAIRKDIYYWKSDRPHTVGNLQRHNPIDTSILESQLADYLSFFFNGPGFELKPANGQGNHITYTATCKGKVFFIRLENGPERDDYMDVESHILQLLDQHGIPCPKVYLSDCSRHRVPFAIQIMEYLSYPNITALNPDAKDTNRIATQIGKFIARWQRIGTEKFGLFNPSKLADEQVLCGYHDTYQQYFFLNLDKHLSYLQAAGFLSDRKVAEITQCITANSDLLQLDKGCLVHKDVAFWNILADHTSIRSFIDWDDAISGDPVDDLSLLGCFHPGQVVMHAIEGYRQECSVLPGEFEKRFWLHLLRNMIFKSVIRVRGKYFDIKDAFFLADASGKDLRALTLDRISSACEGLKGFKSIEEI